MSNTYIQQLHFVTVIVCNLQKTQAPTVVESGLSPQLTVASAAHAFSFCSTMKRILGHKNVWNRSFACELLGGGGPRYGRCQTNYKPGMAVPYQ